MQSVELQLLRSLCRERALAKGLTYSALGRKVGVSLPTIKRWLTKDDIPFAKLTILLSVLDISFSDLHETINYKRSPIRSMPRPKDEVFIANHPREAFVLLLVALKFSFAEIQESLKLTQVELEKHFLSLDRNDLIEYTSKEKFRVLIQVPMKWTSDGAFRKRYIGRLLACIANRAQASHAKFPAERSVNGKGHDLLEFGEFYMSPELSRSFIATLERVVTEHREKSKLELPKIRSTGAKPIGFFVFADSFSPWKEVMWDGR